MFEVIGEVIAGFFVEVASGKFFGGFFKFIQSIGLRVFSLFTGTNNLSTAELRLKYDDRASPWFIGFFILGAAGYLLVSSLL